MPETPARGRVLLQRVFGWARSHLPELSLVSVGVVLRLLMQQNYEPLWGYDFADHWAVVEWYQKHWLLPSAGLSREANHPPLYYFLAGLIRRAGGDDHSVQTWFILVAILRLGLVWFALERYLPGRRLARCAGLALAAVMPCSLYLDGLISNESLMNFLGTLVVVLMLEMFRRPADKRRRVAIALGVALGLSLLTKISGAALVIGVGCALVLEFWLRRELPPGERLRRLAPWSLALALGAVISGGWFVSNQVRYGKPVVDGWFMHPNEGIARIGAEKLPVLDRRTLGYFLGFSTDVWKFPYGPAAQQPPRFWSLLVATTYVDYFNYTFAGKRGIERMVPAGGSILGVGFLPWSRASVWGGTFISAITLLGWGACAFWLLKHREAARLAALCVPAAALVGLMAFVTKNPYEFEGVVKGMYLHYAALPLYGVFGVAVAWFWSHRWLRPLAVVSGICVVAVASFDFFCRLTA
jgi:4-amino-4-deoxy-L-arabinose transferase-like glycosyltransferase